MVEGKREYWSKSSVNEEGVVYEPSSSKVLVSVSALLAVLNGL
jgi:hypothetical protein